MAEETLFQSIKARNTVDYMLRTMQQHHSQLSIMADQKANILLGASFVILTITLGQMRGRGVSIELLILSIFSLAAASCALVAVMPDIGARKPIPLDSPHFNILFFANFTRLNSEEFMKRMETIMQTDSTAYDAILKDIYQLGTVLSKKKYRFITYSYQLFLAGLLCSFSAFMIRSLVVWINTGA